VPLPLVQLPVAADTTLKSCLAWRLLPTERDRQLTKWIAADSGKEESDCLYDEVVDLQHVAKGAWDADYIHSEHHGCGKSPRFPGPAPMNFSASANG
jgi:hypothetical protein